MSIEYSHPDHTAAAAPAPMNLHGRIIWRDGRPATGVSVDALDLDLRGFQSIGRATTDADGNYSIQYTAAQFSLAERDGADLVARVLNPAGAVIASSATMFNAPADATINLTIDQSSAGLISEYDRLTTELSPLLINVVPLPGGAAAPLVDQLADLKDNDITFLSRETGMDFQRLGFLAAGAVLEKQATAAKVSLSTAIFYGIWREGMPTALSALALVDQQKIAGALTQALADNIIAPLGRTTAAAVATVLQSFATTYALQTPAAPGLTSVGALLGTALTAAEQTLFLTAYSSQASQDLPAFWTGLRSNPQLGAKVDAIQLSLQLGVLTSHHVPLIQQLQALRIKTPRDLVRLTAADWTALVQKPGVGVPPDVDGATPQEKVANYVSRIRNLLHAALPAATVANIVASEPVIGMTPAVRQTVSQFFTNAPDFDLHQRVDDFIAANQARVFQGIAAADQPGVVAQVKRLQRLYQVSNSAESLTVLLGTDVQSAHAIAQFSRDSFIAQYQTAVGSATLAGDLFDRAVAINNRSVHTYALIKNGLNGTSPNGPGFGSYTIGSAISKYLPNYATLFGSLDMCQCGHCQSVLSPAAYLVDLFQFLHHSTPNDFNKTPLDLLLARRPDLPDIPLTCENTETPLPYVDLVNEILESYIVHRADPNGQTIVAYDTGDASAAELDANPQNTDRAAYQALASAVYPFTLPFHLPLAVARVYLEHLGSSYSELLHVFRPQDATAEDFEFLQIGSGERLVLNGKLSDGSAAPGVWTFYGYASQNVSQTVKGIVTNRKWNDWLGDVPEFLRRSGLTYDDLLSLVKTRFANPLYPQGTDLDVFQRIPFDFATMQSLQPTFSGLSAQQLKALMDAGLTPAQLQAWWARHSNIGSLVVLAAPGGSCDLTVTRLQHLDGSLLSDAEFSRIHQFIRLWRKLGWTITDLDSALAALAASSIDDALVSRLTRIQQMQASLRLRDIQVLFTFWGDVDTYGDDSLYKKLFLSKAVQSIDDVFLPQSDGSLPPGLMLADHIPAVLAALRIRETDLQAIRAAAELLDPPAPQKPTVALNLSVISTLYRAAALAHALKLTVTDFIDLKTISGVDPFQPANPDGTAAFLKMAEQVRSSGLRVAHLNYVFRHYNAPPVNLAPQPVLIHSLAKTLRDGLAKIAADSAPAPDPGGDLLRQKLGLVYDGAVVANTIAMLDGTAVYTAPLAALPSGTTFPPLVAQKTHYDPNAKTLSFQGAMTDAELTALQTASPVAPYQAAVTSLYNQPDDFLKSTLSDFLDPATAAPVLLRQTPSLDQDLNPVAIASGTAIAFKFEFVLSRLLPYLQDRLSRALVKQAIGAAVKAPASTVSVLLESVLRSTATPAQLAILDSLALATPGLTAAFYTSADLTGASSQQAVGPIDALGSPIPSGTHSARWTGALLAPNNGDVTFTVNTNGVAQLWLAAPGNVPALVGGPVTLKAGLLYDVRLEVTQLPASPAVELRWQGAALPSAVVPVENLYPGSVLNAFALTFTRTHKAAMLANNFGLSAEELAYFSAPQNSPRFDHFDLNSLPFTRDPSAAAIDQQAPSIFRWFLRLCAYTALRNALPKSDVSLLSVFSAATAADAQLMLGQATGWDAAVLKTLGGPQGFALTPADYTTEVALTQLQTAVVLSQRIGVLPAALFQWAQPSAAFDVFWTVAADIKKTVSGKYDADTWLTVAKPLSDVLRQSQRDALVAYVLTVLTLDDPNKLYEQFLVDVEMSACMETSRIKQAISSVQLFVQRSLMSLESVPDAKGKETGVRPEAIATERWDWMKHYRVWEANRKVFLYPENWIEPELRDDKSPFFKELEAELLQGNLTNDSAETAIHNYLAKLETVARLEICGLCWQSDLDPALNRTTDVLHVFGRTFNTPPAYFYRRWVDRSCWTAWEPLNVGIEGDHLIPVIWNRRLRILWPTFLDTTVPPDLKPFTPSNDTFSNHPPVKYWKIRMNWSEYRSGKWQPKQASVDTIASLNVSLHYLTQDPSYVVYAITQLPKEQHLFQAAVINEELAVSVFVSADVVPPFIGTWQLGQFRFDPRGDVVSIGYSSLLQANVSDTPQRSVGGDVGFFYLTPPNDTKARYDMFEETLPTKEFALWDDVRLTNRTFLNATPSVFRVLFDSQSSPPDWLWTPFAYQDAQKTYICSPAATNNTIAVVALASESDLDPSLVVPYTQAPRFGLSRMRALTRAAAASATAAQSQAVSRGWPDVQTREIWNWGIVGVKMVKTDVFFQNHFHPYVPLFRRALGTGGVPRLLSIANQLYSDRKPGDTLDAHTAFANVYQPDSLNVKSPYPGEDVDFSFEGAYSLYNWEIFFHIPLLIATRLAKNQRQEEAEQWFRYIFNPTDNTLGQKAPARYWNVQPFRQSVPDRIDQLLALLSSTDPTQQKARHDVEYQIQQMEEHPFDPHLIARLRHGAYEKNVFMKYLDHLIAWGDQMFAQDTIESINEAALYYVMAADLLGERPASLPPRGAKPHLTYADFKAYLDEFSNAFVDIENAFPYANGNSPGKPASGGGLLGAGKTLFFCVPQNDELLSYWDTVADRLYKIRNCLNIEGVFRQLALFEPPIDPALLVQAAAAGVDISSVLNDLNSPLPYYRFSYMLQKALEMCAEVKSLGSALLSALEKQEAEVLALTRATNEAAVLDLMTQAKQWEVDEATAQIEALHASQATAATDFRAYATLIGDGTALQQGQSVTMLPIPSPPTNVMGLPLLAVEAKEMDEHTSALRIQPQVTLGEIDAAGMATVPQVETATKPMGNGTAIHYGFQNLVAGRAATVRSLQAEISDHSLLASVLGRTAGHIRQTQTFTQERNRAANEFMQIGKQIASANIRLSIASQNLQVHRRQLEDAQNVRDYLKSKFTNQDLYQWMQDGIAATFFQSYQMAYELAKRAERCYRFERGLTKSNFIQFGYWDSLHKGLLSGERLQLALKQLERAYLDQNRRDFELTKSVSLLLLDPVALIRLKETGQCEFELPEWFFDADCPGHFMRRFKNVGMTIPCVAGPYTSVNCTLTLLRNSTRISAMPAQPYPRNEQEDDPRFVTNFVGMQSIVTSTANNDGGQFEVSFHDERYLPFEGAGVISRWRLELNSVVRQFDYGTISDVILHLRYTSRDGGLSLKKAANAALKDLYSDVSVTPLTRAFSLRHEFPNEWQKLTRAPVAGDPDTVVRSVDFAIVQQRFPFAALSTPLQPVSIALVATPNPPIGLGFRQPPFAKLSLELSMGKQPVDLSQYVDVGGARMFPNTNSADWPAIGADLTETWTLGFTMPQNDLRLLRSNLHDLFLIVDYTSQLPG